MKKVITYGTYDLLHQGHLNLLTMFMPIIELVTLLMIFK